MWTENERSALRPAFGSVLRTIAAALAATLVIWLPLVSEQQSVAAVAALTLAALAAGVSLHALGVFAPRPAPVRLRTGHSPPVTPSWVVTQVPCTPARPRAPGRR